MNMRFECSKPASRSTKMGVVTSNAALVAAIGRDFAGLPVRLIELPRTFLAPGEYQQQEVNHKICNGWSLDGDSLICEVYLLGDNKPLRFVYDKIAKDYYRHRAENHPNIRIVRLV